MAKQRNPNGAGSYRKKNDGRYEWRKTVDGKEISRSAKTPKELKEKVKKVSDLPIVTGKYKTEDWFDKWIEVYVKPLKKAATYNQYSDIYRVHIKPQIGFKQIANVTRLDIQTVIAEMNKNNLSSWTMKHARKIMNIAFNKAVEDKLIPESPVIKIEIPVKQKKPIKTLTVDELAKLFKSLKESRWIWSVRFALVTGLRRGELLALKWIDIDIINKQITVDESNSLSGIGDTKSSKIHYVPLSDKAIEYLNGQKNMLEKEFNPILHNEELKKSGLIFPNKSGKMLKPGSYFTLIYRAANKAGIKASPHCLRHTFVYMSRETLSLKEIQEALGHDESTTTLDLYGDMIGMGSKKTAAKIDTVFSDIDKEIKKIENKKPGKVIQFPKAK